MVGANTALRFFGPQGWESGPVAIAGSKLGWFIAKEWSSDVALLSRLREARLVSPDASDDQLMAVFERARQEHASLPEGQRPYNSPNERVRVFLEPYLSDKGLKWAVPLTSLDLPDEDAPEDLPKRPLWKFW
jgi:hypothetical protein